jgi:phage protein U
MIGYFGPIIFETSDSRILNFNDFSHSASASYEKHQIIGQKPRSEFSNPDLETISFTINLNGNHGVKPRDEIEKWASIVNQGEAYSLVIGSKIVGDDLWVCQSISSAWNTLFNQGELFSAKIDISLEEYISEM